ncbi:hypothetical protein Tco_1067145, partial [Tanacetum coccineum]
IIGGGDEEGDGGESGEEVVSVGGGVGEIEVAVGVMHLQSKQE